MNNHAEEAHSTLVMLSFFLFKNLAVRVSIFFIAPIIIFMIPGRYNRL